MNLPVFITAAVPAGDSVCLTLLSILVLRCLTAYLLCLY